MGLAFGDFKTVSSKCNKAKKVDTIQLMPEKQSCVFTAYEQANETD